MKHRIVFLVIFAMSVSLAMRAQQSVRDSVWVYDNPGAVEFQWNYGQSGVTIYQDSLITNFKLSQIDNDEDLSSAITAQYQKVIVKAIDKMTFWGPKTAERSGYFPKGRFLITVPSLGFSIPMRGTESVKGMDKDNVNLDWLYLAGAQFGFGSGALNLGVGMKLQSYSLSNGEVFNLDEKGKLIITTMPEAKRVENSSMEIFGLQFPLLWKQSFPVKLWGTRLEISAGPILTLWASGNINTHCYIEENGLAAKTIINSKYTKMNRTTVDIFGSIRFFQAGSFYVRYSPTRLAEASSPVNFNALSTGFMLFW